MMGRLVKALKPAVKRLPGAVRLAHFLRGLGDPGYRSVRRLRKSGDPNLFQPEPYTQTNRFPLLFFFVRERLSEVAEPKILSYGCSTGEEVFSLRDYFPRAAITGIDINPYSIGLCLERLASLPDRGMTFVCAGSPAAEPAARYDAIFCLSVLRHGDLVAAMPERCDPVLCFQKFEALVADLARCLKPGGYLVLWTCHFRFGDSIVARAFDPVLRMPQGQISRDTLYGSDNRRLDGVVYDEAVFRKKPDGNLSP